MKRTDIHSEESMKRCFTFTLAAALSAGLIFSAPSRATTYIAIDLGTLGGATSHAWGINDGGQVIGQSDTTGNATSYAFITGPNGVGMTDLGTLGGTVSFGLGINANGQVVGGANTSAAQHAFITGANGISMSDLGTLGGTYSYGSAINSSGQVVGDSNMSGDNRNHAFITGPNGVGMTDLGTLGGSNSSAAGINTQGQVVGWSSIGFDFSIGYESTHAFITGANGVGMTDLGTLGGLNGSHAYGINDSGLVVGDSYTTGNAADHAFITGANGVGMKDLGSLGGDTSVAYGINASGIVVGYSYLVGTTSIAHAFVTGPNGIGMTDLNSLVDLGNGDYLFMATGVNDIGQIVAESASGHAYLITSVPEAERVCNAVGGPRPGRCCDSTQVDHSVIQARDVPFLSFCRKINR
jgi:probable HAF family extracellular repeat protein